MHVSDDHRCRHCTQVHSLNVWQRWYCQMQGQPCFCISWAFFFFRWCCGWCRPSKGSVSKFTEVVKQESTMYQSVQTSTTCFGGSQMALGSILHTLSKTKNLYNILSTGNNMHIPSRCINNCCQWNDNQRFNNASYQRIKLALRPTRRSGKKKRRRRILDLVVVTLAMEKDNMKGPSWDRTGTISNLKVVWKSVTMFGICTKARVVGRTVPIHLNCHSVFTLNWSSFSSLLPVPIFIIRRLQKNSSKDFLYYLLLRYLLQDLLPLATAAMAWSILTWVIFWCLPTSQIAVANPTVTAFLSVLKSC